MVDITISSLDQQEKMGRKRFDTGIEFEKIIMNMTRTIQDRMIISLPSNYPKDRNTNLSELYRAIAEEFARLQSSISNTNDDQYHDRTRAQYLYEILGDTLFLDQKAINYNISDEAYRTFLITVRNAYFGGSRKDNIEQAVSDIIGVPVHIKELYLDLRREDTSYTVKDTHKMFFDILMDFVSSTSSLGQILENLKYFLDLIKPAHVLYDTRLIWTDAINKDRNCTPSYVGKEMAGIIYGVDNIDMLTYVVDRLYYFPTPIIEPNPNEKWVEGVVDSVSEDKGIIYLQNKTILVVDTNSILYERTKPDDELIDTPIVLADLSSGDAVKYYATKDGPGTSGVITTDWLYEDVITAIDTGSETISLASGKTIVYNTDVLVYTRDKTDEYRIFVEDLLIGYTIAFKGTKYTESFDFYNTPKEVLDNAYKQFDPEIINKPYFQDNVKKIPETRDGLPIGPAVVMVDGVATAIDVESKFYKRDGAVNYKSFNAYRYSLYIDNVYTNQITIEEPDQEITEQEAKLLFETGIYGYTGLDSSNYRIDVSTTAYLKETADAPTVQAVGDHTDACDRRAECHLMPYYEDTRKYQECPDVLLTSGFINTVTLSVSVNLPGQYNIPGYFIISSDPNSYQIAMLPILNASGNPATTSDLVVYVNGLRVENAVSSVNPWTGEVVLNFLPPANSKIRIDYYYSGKYPQSQYYIEKAGEIQSSHRLQWPFPVTGLYGDEHDFQVEHYPILNQQGNLASPSDIETFVGDLGATGFIVSKINLVSSDILVADSGLTGIYAGDTLIIKAQDIFDNTLIYTIAGITGTNGFVINKKFPADIIPGGLPFEVIGFTGATGAVDHVRPLLGHIHMVSAPVIGSFVKFKYYFSESNRTYVMVPDVIGDTGPYMNLGYTPDTFYGNHSGFTLVPDMGITGSEKPIFEYDSVAKIGYRYRAFNLSNSSVLDSKDTLVLDGYSKEQGRASWKNNRNLLDQYSLLFSPEYLTDTNKNVILNDKYLERALDPVTKLYPGTPLFVKTFSDDGHFKDNTLPEGVNTYQEPSQSSYDLQAGFTIVGTDTSGLVDYQPVCEFEKNRRIRLYSGLKVVETDFTGFQGPLSTISEGQRSIPFKTLYIEQYYPNREQRLNDYLDYVNRVPEDIKLGTVKTFKNSKIIKKIKGNWLVLRRGDMLTLKDVPYDTGTRDIIYTVVNVIDYETAELSTTFKEVTGEYDYELTRDTVYKVDVYLNEINRALVLNGSENYTYSLPAAMLSHLPGYGVTGVHFELYFSDPDKDPYPRSPDNPNINGLPTGDRSLLVTHETGLGPTDLNTIPLIREIIDADGNSVTYGLSGGLFGYTGPSGAVDLGLTGPTGDNIPRLLEADDKYVIPSGASGVFWSVSESEYRVNWRNWDQEMIIINFGPLTGPNAGVIQEEPVNMTNDLGEGIRRDYWGFTGAIGFSYAVPMLQYYFGSLVETSEIIDGPMTDPQTVYPSGMVVLNVGQQAAGTPPNPASSYYVRRRIVRELLQDGGIKVTEVYEFKPV